MKKYFLNSAFAGWLKVFISAVLLQVLNSMTEGYSLFTYDWPMIQKILNAGFVALLPVIINYLNPNDPRYGRTKDVEIAPKGTTEAVEDLAEEVIKSRV